MTDEVSTEQVEINIRYPRMSRPRTFWRAYITDHPALMAIGETEDAAIVSLLNRCPWLAAKESE